MIEFQTLMAKAHQARHSLSEAARCLETALELALPGPFIRVFIDEGAPVEALLRMLKPEQPKLRAFVDTLLAAFQTKAGDHSLTASQGLIEPLSEREIEVLHHIAEGLTNQQIATRLYLSLNTIKVHTRNIYAKLGVNNRTQAVIRANELGIIQGN